MSVRRKIGIGALVLLILLIVVWRGLFFANNPYRERMIYGVSFNADHARYLGLDPRAVFTAVLDELGFRYVRLSAQWNNLEKEKGVFDFTELDWFMDEAAKRGALVMLAVGQKTPRWPECHIPGWAQALEEERYREVLFAYMEAAVERYKHHPALELWQVENEPFLPFGICKTISKSELLREIAFVQQIDPSHKAIVTDSGELSTWRRTARATDVFGTTLYTVVWSKILGYWSYDWLLPPAAYRAKLWINGRETNQAYITELQAEPWIPYGSVHDTPLEEQFKSMSLERLKANVSFAARTGMPRSYLWGVEWWHWLKDIKGAGDFVEYVKTLKKE